ncbi:MAG: IgGFc-binding protein [Chlorobiota bacterium]|jgi:hypothetical protein|nr:MAG: IgGFc-binding protein [Chlorobiota bacterium]
MKFVKIILSIFCFLSITTSIKAQVAGLGKEFFFAFPSNWEQSQPFRNIRIYLLSTKKTEVKVWAGSVLKKTVFTIPNDVVSVDLLPQEGQVFTKSDTKIVPRDSVYIDKALHVRSVDPIAVYGMNSITGTREGMTILPVNQCGRDYIVSTAPGLSSSSQLLCSQFMITGLYASSQVFITLPKHTITGSRDSSVEKSFEVSLNRGDVYSLMSKDEVNDLSGAIITCNRPIAVTAGTQCSILPLSEFQYCDHVSEMLHPITNAGNLFYTVPFPLREKGDLFKIFATEDSTDVYYNDETPVRINRFGNDLELRESWYTTLPIASNLSKIRSNKPIQVMQFNNSQSYDKVKSDPYGVVLTPFKNYSNNYLFYVGDLQSNFINIVCDSNEYLNIEYKTGENGTWKKISGLTPIRKNFYFDGNIGLTLKLGTGAYQIRGTKPFHGIVCGNSDSEGYGFPFTNNINLGFIPDTINPITSIISSDCRKGSYTIRAQDLPSIDSIRINLYKIEDVELSNYKLIVDPINEGVTISSNYKLEVMDVRKGAQAIVAVYDYNGNTKLDTFIYKPKLISTEKKIIDMGLKIGEFKLLNKLTIKNELTNPTDVVLSLKDNSGFVINSPKRLTLQSLGTSEIIVEYNNSKVGPSIDTLLISDDCGPILGIELSAKTLAPSEIGALDLDFGSIDLNKINVQDLIIKNNSQSESILSISDIKPPFDFGAFKFTEGIPPYPIQIDNGKSVKIKISFKPQIEKKYIDSVIVTSNSITNGSNKYQINLIGTGVLGIGNVNDFDKNVILNAFISEKNLKLEYTVLGTSFLSVSLYDISGKSITSIFDGNVNGKNTILKDISELPTGQYYVYCELNGKKVKIIKIYNN